MNPNEKGGDAGSRIRHEKPRFDPRLLTLPSEISMVRVAISALDGVVVSKTETM
jgi:hypothetical protein